MARPLFIASILCALGAVTDARAATSSAAVPSPMGGNGFNISFDGRLFIVRRAGWELFLFRPESLPAGADALPNLFAGAFTEPVLLATPDHEENAVALCEPDADATPYACDAAGNGAGNAPGGGDHDCYDLVLLDSDALGDMVMRRRRLRLIVGNPRTPSATLTDWQWIGGIEPLVTAQGPIVGIEPTVSRDGRLMVYQGHPNNDRTIDILMYTQSAQACSLDGWAPPRTLSHMFNDPAVGSYPLAQHVLRAADGSLFADGDLIRGAYPWLFPDGEAVIFTSAAMPCRAAEDPPGCGPRRNALAILGYPTNWGVAHIDGGLNPSTTDTVRLFFSSPGPRAYPQLPVSGGTDVWPFFGSNTSNYAEVVFDDGLDGNYAAVWHMNELVSRDGELRFDRTADSSGYFNTAVVEGATFPAANNTPTGKGLVFDGTSARVWAPSNASLNPVNAVSVEMRLRVDAPVDCNGNNNWRVLLAKGNIVGPYSLVLEEGEVVRGRVSVAGVDQAVVSSRALSLGVWSDVALVFDGRLGTLSLYIDGELDAERSLPAGSVLDANTSPVYIGGPGSVRPACPDGNGVLAGVIDDVRISRVPRMIQVLPRDAAFVGQDVPSRVGLLEPFTATVTLRNTGAQTWTAFEQYRLGSQAPQDNALWGTGRIELPHDVPPGTTVTFTLDLTAPGVPGPAAFQWRMVQEGVTWFGETTPLATIAVADEPVVGEPDGGEPDGGTDPGTGGDERSGDDDLAGGDPMLDGDPGAAGDPGAGGDEDVTGDAVLHGDAASSGSVGDDGAEVDAPGHGTTDGRRGGCSASGAEPSWLAWSLLLVLALRARSKTPSRARPTRGERECRS